MAIITSKVFGIVALTLLISSCATRSVTVVDTAADVVRIDKPVKAKVSVKRGAVWSEAGTMMLPAGWYAGPGPEGGL